MFKAKEFQLLSLFLSFFLLAACSKPIDIKIGDAFSVKGNTVKLEGIEERKILVNDESQLVKMAPEGMHYIHLKIHNPAGELVIVTATKGEEKLEPESSITLTSNFMGSITEGYMDEMYLVKDGDDVQFSMRTLDKTIYKVTNTEYPNKDDRQVAAKMNELMAKYASGANLLEPLKEFIAVENVYDIAEEKGEDVPTSPIVKGMEIVYISKDGRFYQTRSKFMGASLYSEIKWEGDHIVDFKFELP